MDKGYIYVLDKWGIRIKEALDKAASERPHSSPGRPQGSLLLIRVHARPYNGYGGLPGISVS